MIPSLLSKEIGQGLQAYITTGFETPTLCSAKFPDGTVALILDCRLAQHKGIGVC